MHSGYLKCTVEWMQYGIYCDILWVRKRTWDFTGVSVFSVFYVGSYLKNRRKSLFLLPIWNFVDIPITSPSHHRGNWVCRENYACCDGRYVERLTWMRPWTVYENRTIHSQIIGKSNLVTGILIKVEKIWTCLVEFHPVVKVCSTCNSFRTTNARIEFLIPMPSN